MCVCVCGGDAAAASALGTVHLYMTGAPAAFDPSVSPRKGPDNPISSTLVPTRSFSGVKAVQGCHTSSEFFLSLRHLSSCSGTSGFRGTGGGGDCAARCVWRGKSGHVGLDERWREEEEAAEGRGCRGMLVGLRNPPSPEPMYPRAGRFGSRISYSDWCE